MSFEYLQSVRKQQQQQQRSSSSGSLLSTSLKKSPRPNATAAVEQMPTTASRSTADGDISASHRRVLPVYHLDSGQTCNEDLTPPDSTTISLQPSAPPVVSPLELALGQQHCYEDDDYEDELSPPETPRTAIRRLRSEKEAILKRINDAKMAKAPVKVAAIPTPEVVTLPPERGSAAWPDWVRKIQHEPFKIGGTTLDEQPAQQPESEETTTPPAPPSAGRPASGSSESSNSPESSLSADNSRESSKKLESSTGSVVSEWSKLLRATSPGLVKDEASIEQQINAVLKVVRPSLCRRGWRCWQTDAPCGGRMERYIEEMTTPTTEISATGTTVRVRRPLIEDSGKARSRLEYKHRTDEFDPSLESARMEYIAALLFLRDCEEDQKTGRRSDDLLVHLDAFVESLMTRHPLRGANGSKVPPDDPEAQTLLTYLMRDPQHTKLRVSNGALIAAGLYLRLVHLEELGDSHKTAWVPIYVRDHSAIIVSTPALTSQLTSSARKASTPVSILERSATRLQRVMSTESLPKLSLSDAMGTSPPPEAPLTGSRRKGSIFGRLFTRPTSITKDDVVGASV